MVAFAANSLLARAALGPGAIDAAGFTTVRLISGGLALAALLLWQRGRAVLPERPGSWPSAVALLVYALAFSFAYLRLGAATGALILFAAVQGTMILWGLALRHRPTVPEVAGLAVAFAAFVYLLLPGLDTPDLAGSLLMTAAGIAWGVYSLRGRGQAKPLAATGGNFVRAAAMCVPLAAWSAIRGHASADGIGLAVVSGVVTSGLGYAVWYRALPHLTPMQAATVQLTVPPLATIGAMSLLGEALTLRLALSSLCILGGVALAITARR
jgi:drug/metabolite transporter (DMT)-like permease